METKVFFAGGMKVPYLQGTHPAAGSEGTGYLCRSVARVPRTACRTCTLRSPCTWSASSTSHAAPTTSSPGSYAPGGHKIKKVLNAKTTKNKDALKISRSEWLSTRFSLPTALKSKGKCFWEVTKMFRIESHNNNLEMVCYLSTGSRFWRWHYLIFVFFGWVLRIV